MDTVSKEMFDIIGEYHVPNKNSGMVRNEAAKKALIKFHEKLKDVEPKEWYIMNGNRLFYMHFLMVLRQALIDNNYEVACNELGSLIYRYPISEQRIRAIVLHTLERYL